MIVNGTCPECQISWTLGVSDSAYEKWKEGTLIQNAFPELPAEKRELLITGICGECWNKIFA